MAQFDDARWLWLQVFYNGLMSKAKDLVNASAGSSFKGKFMVEVTELFKKIAKNSNLGSNERRMPMRKQAGLMEVDASVNRGAQLTVLTHKMGLMKARMGVKQVLYCGLCQGEHRTDQCQPTMEPVNFVNDYGRPRSYNPNWRNRPQWGNQNRAQWESQAQQNAVINQGPPGFVNIFVKNNEKKPANPSPLPFSTIGSSLTFCPSSFSNH